MIASCPRSPNNPAADLGLTCGIPGSGCGCAADAALRLKQVVKAPRKMIRCSIGNAALQNACRTATGLVKNELLLEVLKRQCRSDGIQLYRIPPTVALHDAANMCRLARRPNVCARGSSLSGARVLSAHR